MAALPPAAFFFKKYMLVIFAIWAKEKRRGTSAREISRRNCGEISGLVPNGEEHVNQKRTFWEGIANSGAMGGRRPTGSGGFEARSPPMEGILDLSFIHTLT